MTNLERAIAALEASSEQDLVRLCGADRLTFLMLLRRWDRLLAATAPRRKDDGGELGLGTSGTKIEKSPKTEPGPPRSVGVLALLASGERSP